MFFFLKEIFKEILEKCIWCFSFSNEPDETYPHCFLFYWTSQTAALRSLRTNRKEAFDYSHQSCNRSNIPHFTFSKVLSVVVVDLPPAAVFVDQVALGAAQVDLAELQDEAKEKKQI